jgi:hypothetical protein
MDIVTHRRTVLALLLGVLLGAQSALAQSIPDPTFEPETLDDDVAIGYGLQIGDVDGDGDEDILLADKNEIVWYRNGDWQRFVMAADLTERDNVCITARDLNGDGQVEVAVGANWNPGNTTDPEASGSVHYLIRPDDPTERWEPVTLPNEPTVHRMHWTKMAEDRYALVVLPIHGWANENAEGPGVRILAYVKPENPRQVWEKILIDDRLNLTHNFHPRPLGNRDRLYIGGRQGAITAVPEDGMWQRQSAEWLEGIGEEEGVSEIRYGTLGDTELITTIEPFHGNTVNVYVGGANGRHHELTDAFNQGHALAAADLLGIGRDQVIAGWRDANEAGNVGIRLFVPTDEEGSEWSEHEIDTTGMATEDLKVADLDGDGLLDVIASGRDTHNLIVYWNRTEM